MTMPTRNQPKNQPAGRNQAKERGTRPPRAPRQPRRTVRTVVAVAVLAALLFPVGYLFTRLWTGTGDTVRSLEGERAGVAYARPLTQVLAALLDAQNTAVIGGNVDPTDIRDAVDQFNKVDRQYGDPVGVRQRWGQVSHEIDAVLAQKPTGADAVGGYATSIGLAQVLLDRIADASKIAPTTNLSGYHLIETGLQSLPAVTVNAGQVTALAHVIDLSTTPSSSRRTGIPDPRLTVAQDRLSQAADEVTSGLRSSGDSAPNYPVDLSLLGPLDEFAAAVDELNQTVAGLTVPNSGARNRIDAANDRVQKAGLTLQTAVLNTFDSQVSGQVDSSAGQRRTLVIAGIVIALTAAALLWLRVPGAAPVEGPEEPAQPLRPPSTYPREPEPEPIPDLMDARDLLAPELVHMGRAVRTRKRRDGDDPR